MVRGIHVPDTMTCYSFVDHTLTYYYNCRRFLLCDGTRLDLNHVLQVANEEVVSICSCDYYWFTIKFLLLRVHCRYQFYVKLFTLVVNPAQNPFNRLDLA